VGGGVGVAWFPLAPREVFVPWYRTSPTYVNNVNVTNTRVNVTQVTNVYNTTIINNNTTNITRVNYVNQHVTNAVTAVSHETFVNARPVANNIVRVDPKQIAEAPVLHRIAEQPVKASVMGVGRPTAAVPPATVVNRQVVATRVPTPPRAPLEQRQGAVPERATPNVRTETPGQPQAVARGENRPGQPAAQPAVPRPGQPTASPSRPPTAVAPPATARPEPPSMGNRAPQEPDRSTSVRMPERAVPHPPAGEGGHPLVRPAPPVQENPRLQQSEQTKFNTWQQQRSAAPRPPEPRAAEPQRSAPRAPEPPAREVRPH